MRLSVQPRDQIFVKDGQFVNGFLSFAEKMSINISKNISQTLKGNYR